MGIGYNTSIVRDGLVLHLDAANVKSYPGSGTTWSDVSGQGNNGTLVNGASITSNNFGTINIDGVNDYVDLSAGSYNWTTANSIMIAFKPHNVNNRWGQVIQKADRFDMRIRFINTTGRFEMFYELSDDSTTYQYSTTGALQNNQWYIAQTSIDTGSIGKAQYYLNGEKVYDQTVNTSLQLRNGSNELLMGSYGIPGGEWFNGEIGFCLMYDRFLSESEARANFEAMRGRYGI